MVDMSGDTSETKEGAGGWIVPKSVDRGQLRKDLHNANFTLRYIEDGAEVYVGEHGNVSNLHQIAAQNGFTLNRMDRVKGDFHLKVYIKPKGYSRNIEDSKEHNYRLDNGENHEEADSS